MVAKKIDKLKETGVLKNLNDFSLASLFLTFKQKEFFFDKETIDLVKNLHDKFKKERLPEIELRFRQQLDKEKLKN